MMITGLYVEFYKGGMEQEMLKGKKISKVLIYTMMLSILLGSTVFAQGQKIGIDGYGYVQDYDDVQGQDVILDSIFRIGTIGEGKRLEGVDLKLDSAPSNMMLVYRAHVQDHGDMPKKADKSVWRDPKDGLLWQKADSYLGIKGEGKRLEAIQFRLIDTRTNRDYDGYTVEYQVHMAQYGWGIDNRTNALKLLGNPRADVDRWQSKGGLAGTKGERRRIEAINIRIRPTDSAGGYLGESEIILSGYGHVQTHGDLKGRYTIRDTVFRVGTMGKGKRLEGFSLKLRNAPSNMMLVYRAHVQYHGDMPKGQDSSVWRDPKDGSLWLKSDGYIGTREEFRRIEGIQLRLINTDTDEDYMGYRIEYQVHMAQYGWGVDSSSNALKISGDPRLGVDVWKATGHFAGTKGEARRLEAINVRIRPGDPFEEERVAAQKVVKMIDALPDPSAIKEAKAALKDAAAKARAEYRALTDRQKTFVTNMDKLNEVEERLMKLEARENFINLVNGLPRPESINQIKADEKVRSEQARELYDGMSREDRASIPRHIIDKLVAVENRIEELKTPLMRESRAAIEQAQTWAIMKGAHSRFIHIAPTYWDYGKQTGINPETLYCQAAKETNFGRYTGAVKPEMNNWAGIKTDNPSGDQTYDHEIFKTPEDGVRAHFNHMGIYCGVDPIGQPHPRWYITKTAGWAGKVKHIEDLGGRWAPNPDYGISIVRDYMRNLYSTQPLSEGELKGAIDVIDTICTLADREELTLEDGEDIRMVRIAFEALSEPLKADYYKCTLEEIERRYEELLRSLQEAPHISFSTSA